MCFYFNSKTIGCQQFLYPPLIAPFEESFLFHFVIFADLDEAGKEMDASKLFESAHAIKGVCSNLGLVKLSDAAAEICDEFRPGNARKFTDEEIKNKIGFVDAMFAKAVAGIEKYGQSGQ